MWKTYTPGACSGHFFRRRVLHGCFRPRRIGTRISPRQLASLHTRCHITDGLPGGRCTRGGNDRRETGVGRAAVAAGACNQNDPKLPPATAPTMPYNEWCLTFSGCATASSEIAAVDDEDGKGPRNAELLKGRALSFLKFAPSPHIRKQAAHPSPRPASMSSAMPPM